jgi:hypothetical protein
LGKIPTVGGNGDHDLYEAAASQLLSIRNDQELVFHEMILRVLVFLKDYGLAVLHLLFAKRLNISLQKVKKTHHPRSPVGGTPGMDSCRNCGSVQRWFG